MIRWKLGDNDKPRWNKHTDLQEKIDVMESGAKEPLPLPLFH